MIPKHMPPKASNKIATAIAAVNRTVVRNVKAANRAVVKNYNAANRAINRAPAWVKWTIAAIAVAIIGYALWKVFFAGKKEGYDTKEDIDVDFDKKYTQKKLTGAGLDAYNINNVIPGMYNNGEKIMADEETIKRKHSIFYSDMNVLQAAEDCKKNDDCKGFEIQFYSSKIRGTSDPNTKGEIRFLGNTLSDSIQNDYLTTADADIWIKKPKKSTVIPETSSDAEKAAAAAAAAKEPWVKDFQSLDSTEYIVYLGNITGSGIVTLGNQDGAVTNNVVQVINAFKLSNNSNVLVFRGDNRYWLRKADNKDSFKGAMITNPWNTSDSLENQFVTVIKKGTLNFANFDEVKEKTKESTTGAVDKGAVAAADPTVDTGVYKADYDGNPDNWIVPLDLKYTGIKKFDIEIAGLERSGPMSLSFKKALDDFASSPQVKVMKYYDTGNVYFYSTTVLNKNDDFRGKNITTPVQKYRKYTSVVLMKTDSDLTFQTSQEILNISKLPVNIDVYSGGKTLYDGVNIGGGGTDVGSKTEIDISDITDAANKCAANSFNAGAQGFTLRKKENAEGIWECWPKKYTADALKSTNFEYSSPSQRTYIFDSAKDDNVTDNIVNHGIIGTDVPSMKTWWNSSRPVNIENNKDKFFIRRHDSSKYLDINQGNKLWVWTDTPSYSFQVSNGTLKVFDGTGKTEYTDKMFGTRTPASGPPQALVMTYEGGTVVTNLTFTPVAGQVNKYKIFMNSGSGSSILYYHDDVDTPWINAFPGFTNPSNAKTEFILEPVMPS